MEQLTQILCYDENGHAQPGPGGRHVMQIGTRLIDGSRKSFTGAQYINSAYRVPSQWTNKAEMKAGGTIRVKKNKTIHKGEEILFAYNNSYWRRWGPTKRGRPRKAPSASTSTSTNTPSPTKTSKSLLRAHNADHTNAADSRTNPTHLDTTAATLQEDNGVRVTQHVEPVATSKRGRKKKARETTPHRANKRQATQYAWSAISRDEFNRVQKQQCNVQSEQQLRSAQRFEQGEGGGVT